MLLWRFVGRTNVILSNGVNWQRHSRVVKSALNRNVPIEKFALLTKRLFGVMGDGGRLRFDDLTMVRIVLILICAIKSLAMLTMSLSALYARRSW